MTIYTTKNADNNVVVHCSDPKIEVMVYMSRGKPVTPELHNRLAGYFADTNNLPPPETHETHSDSFCAHL